jgi:predicted dehydrogenase
LAQIDYSRNYLGDFWENKIDADARPGENLDWNAFLGPAPKRPFDPDRFFSWRRYWDYSGGIATDLFIHRVTRMIKSLGLTFPQYASAAGGKFAFRDSKAEIPDTLNILLDYPQELTVQLISSMANETPVQHMIRGHKATLQFTKTGFEITPQRFYAKEEQPVTYQKHGAEALDLHHRNLLNAIRQNEPLRCDANLGYYGVVAAAMGNLAYRRRKCMRWDAARQRALAA